MGEVIKMKVVQAPAFTDMRSMLNQWYREQDKKPLAKPVRIRHVVEMAHAAGWSLEECYKALSCTWAFTESAFETALRRIADEKVESDRRVSNITDVIATKQALNVHKKESLSVEENIRRLRELKKELRSKG